MDKIAIILTTFLRDDLLEKSIKSIEACWQTNWRLFIIDQNPTKEKAEKYKFYCYLPVAYDCGLSYSRNLGVKMAKEFEIPYCLITADSIAFDASMINESVITTRLEHEGLNLCGLNLKNRIAWEGLLDLIPNQHFEIDFIEKPKSRPYSLWSCEIVRNFFIATTDSLYKTKWDEELKMGEHESFFWEYKQKGYKVCCTDLCSGSYIGVKPAQYRDVREKNFHEGLQKLKKKYHISGWVKYKHLERIKK
jgi:glycosyltransferase involved in cell wall biosynthesis